MIQLNDYQLPTRQMHVSISGQLQSQSLGGETSDTASAHKGIKPKEISITFIILFAEPEKLTEFIATAEAVDANGALVQYNISHAGANAANIRQVEFCGNYKASELRDHKAWRISCKLKERKSVPEKIEQRQGDAKAGANTQTGQPGAASPEAEQKPVEGFERVIKYADELLADDEEAEP